MKKTVALAAALAFAASSTFAGGLAPVVQEPAAPVIVEETGSSAGMGLGLTAAGVVGVALLVALLNDDDDDTTN